MIRSLQSEFKKILLMSSVIPGLITVILLVTFLISINNETQDLKVRSKINLKSEIVNNVKDSLRSLRLITTSAELVSFFNSSPELRLYTSNLLYGRLNKIQRMDKLISQWVVSDGNSTVLESSNDFPEVYKKIFETLAPKKYFRIQDNTFLYKTPIQLDDQFLQDDSSKVKGYVGIVINLTELVSSSSELLAIESLPSSLEVEGVVVMSSTSSSLNISIILMIIFFLVGTMYFAFIFLGISGFRQRIIFPILNLNNYVQGNEKFHNSNIEEIESIKENHDHSISRIQGMQTSLAEAVEAKVLANQARQVAHDIRSPLSFLQILLDDLKNLPDSRRRPFQMAVKRIGSIVDDLVARGETSGHKNTQKLHALSFITEVFEEKRREYSRKENIDISFSSTKNLSSIFILADKGKINRAFSNIINNAVESIEGSGQVSIEVLELDKRTLSVKVQDSGCGMPPEVKDKIGEEGFSYKKSGGSGLGLYSSKKYVGAAGGQLRITSEVGKGTLVDVLLPKEKAPDWFQEDLSFLKEYKKIKILEDDKLFQEVLKEKMPYSLEFFESTQAFKKSFVEDDEINSKAFYVLDYEILGEDETGLDLIEELCLGRQSFLMTNRYDDKEVQDRARSLGVKILPKPLLPYIFP